MPFVKVVKNKPYFKRYQVKYRRRREGKTDYRARKRLCAQSKNKYNQPKYRLVVRFSNTKVVTQIIKPTIEGDRVVCSAYSNELPRYGLSVGLKNFSAAYCTGLLLARRLLKQLGLDSIYEGETDPNGEVNSTEMDGRTYYVDEVDEEKRPFRALLDVGIRNTTTGSRVFAALKGASDGGLDVPHSEKRFPGYDREEKEYNPEVLKDRIFGEHVKEYMNAMQEDDPEKYAAHFAHFIKAGINGDDLEDLYKKVHAAIRADPSPAPKKAFTPDKKFKRTPKLSYEVKKAQTAERKKAIEDAAAEESEEDEESEEEEDDE